VTRNLRAPLFTKDSGHSFANVVAGWNQPTTATNQSDLATFKALDLQIGKISGTEIPMNHKMGLVRLDMTTGKSVSNTVTYTYTTSSVPTPVYSGTATIYPEHSFTSASGYCYPLNAATASTDCYYIVKSTGSSTSSSAKFGCSTTNTTEYWSDFTMSGIGYGKCSSKKVESVRNAKNFVATFAYCGACQTVTLPWYGTYKLQVWGAAGGGWGNHAATPGGYSYGNKTLDASSPLFVCVGGTGLGAGVGSLNSYNGGGANSHGGGGGATHIATRTGVLSSLSSYKSSVIIVAGGGGSNGMQSAGLNGTTTCHGGFGGGATGGWAQGSTVISYLLSNVRYNTDVGATQDRTGLQGIQGGFGKGANGIGWGGCGGGGWYGGSAGGGNGLSEDSGGGGGSGYVGGCESPANTLQGTIWGNTTFESFSGGTEKGHIGNGNAKITSQ